MSSLETTSDIPHLEKAGTRRDRRTGNGADDGGSAQSGLRPGTRRRCTREDERAMRPSPPFTRRHLLSGAAAVLGVAGSAPARAALVLTPRQSRGPYYPVELPFDQDNDLVHVRGREVPARGEVVVVQGRVRDERGRPVADSRVEIWQCDANGRYHHPRDRRNVPLDENFQGWGRFRTAGDGRYFFRTIRPVPYPGRAPHIHFAISGPGFETLVTQMYVDGAPENERDWLLASIRDPRQRASVLVRFAPEPAFDGIAAGTFDIVLRNG